MSTEAYVGFPEANRQDALWISSSGKLLWEQLAVAEVPGSRLARDT